MDEEEDSDVMEEKTEIMIGGSRVGEWRVVNCGNGNGLLCEVVGEVDIIIGYPSRGRQKKLARVFPRV